MENMRHFGRISYTTSQIAHSSYQGSVKGKSSSKIKSSNKEDPVPANSLELIPIHERFLHNQRSFQRDAVTRHSGHFINHKRLDGSIFNGKTDVLQSRFLSNNKTTTLHTPSPKRPRLVKINSNIDSNTQREELYLNKQVSNKL